MQKLGNRFHGEGLVFPLMGLAVPWCGIELGAAGLAITLVVRHGLILLPIGGVAIHDALAEGVGFEPTLVTRTRTVFKTVSINRSDTPPQRKEMIAQAVPVVTVGEDGWQDQGCVEGREV